VPHPNPYPLCIFCGAKADSREHAIPRWVARRLRLRGVRLAHEGVSTIPTSRKQTISFASHRERIFCKNCNTHFKHLEDEAIPVLEWMAKGRSIILGEVEQNVLARWGAKTGFALIAAEKESRDFVPREQMAWLRQKNEPHPLNWVGYASWNGKAFKGLNKHSITAPKLDGEYIAYTEVLAFAQLAFKLFGLFTPIPQHRIEGDWDALRQVWPSRNQRISWPTGRVAGNADWKELMTILPLEPN